MMKVIKFMLVCIIGLLVFGIYIIIDKDKKDISLGGENITCTMSDEESDEDRIVTCKACGGTGHDMLKEGEYCNLCNGARQMMESEMDKRYEKWVNEVVTCSYCGGTGQSYEYRATEASNPLDIIINVPRGYYDCKVCKGKKEGPRAELIKNFKAAQQVYGPAL